MFKREDGEPLVTLNYYRKIIDKIVHFLVGKGFTISTPVALEEVTKPFLNEVWEYNNRQRFSFESATTGSITGDVFALITFEEPSPMQRRVYPYSQGHIRINLLGSEQVYPTWDPLNQDTLVAARIETIYYAERGTRQLDRDDRVNHEGRQLYTKRFTQIITRDSIVEQYHGDQPIVRPNLLGEIPLVHIKNLPLPKEYYGLSDGQDLIDLNRELNEKSTDISDSINYHSAPVTIIYGAKAKNLEKGPKQVWSGLPVNARVENLKLEGDLRAANEYWGKIKLAMHELSDVPEASLGKSAPISNTSGVALHMQYEPLIERRDKKRAMYEPGFAQINYFILRIGMIKGLINLPFDLCSRCGGRIVQIETGETVSVWDPSVEAFVTFPKYIKKCYHIDKQTLEFLTKEEYQEQIAAESLSDVLEVPDVKTEAIRVTQRLTNPRTGEVLGDETRDIEAVPTGCKVPTYLNPFTNVVKFLEVLPKDEAQRAQLFGYYQDKGWVDPEWCRNQILEISQESSEIKKRMILNARAVAKATHQELAPPVGMDTGVPGKGGNPILPLKQLDLGSLESAESLSGRSPAAHETGEQ